MQRRDRRKGGRPWICGALLAPLLASCALFEDPPQLTAEEQYDEAQSFSERGDTDKAIELYRELIASYPQSSYAQQAILDIAYENYRVQRYKEAIAAAERFREEYPSHSRVDYAYYLIGLSHFREDRGLLDRISREDPAERDRQAMLDAYETFESLVALFPDSIYRNDSIARMRYLINTLARHEAKVARYYLSRKAWLSGINRANYILDRFPDSSSNEEALAMLVAGYAALGLEQERQDALRVFDLSYPESALRAPATAGAEELLEQLDPGRYEQDWLFTLMRR